MIYASQFKSDAKWDWHHSGAKAQSSAQVEFTSNHKVRWDDGNEHGSWKFID